MCVHRTPALYYVCDQNLLRVVSGIWTNAPDDSAEVAVRATHNLWGKHPWLQWLEDGSEACVKKLTTEVTKSSRISIFVLGFDSD